VPEEDLQGLARLLKLGSLNQSLIIGVADFHDLAGRELGSASAAPGGLLSFRDGLL
jgi:hypothetical protein